MNEAFQLRLRRNGRTWPIDAFGGDGIVLSNERDAFPRTVTVEFDAQIRTVLESPESSLDGQSIEQWLSSPDTRPNRKACLLNLMAKLRSVPDPRTPLITEVRNIFFAGTERVYCQVNGNLLNRLQTLADDPKRPFYSEGNPTSPMHR